MLPSSPITVPQLLRPACGDWPVPGSKSITNRALVLAALAEGDSVLEGALASDDTRHMRRCLEQLGIVIRDSDQHGLLVRGGRSRLRPCDEPLFVGNSGTTVRFLAALAVLVPGATTLVGDPHMAERPIADLVEALRQLGVRVDCASGCPPLTVHGGDLAGGSVSLRGDRSSQYLSALLMAGGLAAGVIDITITGTLVSRPYATMTQALIADFGGQVETIADGFRIHPSGGYRARSCRIEPDASAASYPFALAAAGGGSLRVPHLGPDATQGDVAFTGVLAAMGAHVDAESHGITVSATSRLRGIEVAMRDISDCVMTLAAIAPLCQGPTVITDIANIRIKETDRLAACANELRRLGQGVEAGDDWLRIDPAPIQAATVACYDDHRMAMAFAVLGLLTGQVTIADPGCVAKTYPGFWDAVAACCRACGTEATW